MSFFNTNPGCKARRSRGAPMQNPTTGVRWIVAAITSISITAFAPGHAASVAPVAAENGMVVSAQHLATKVGVDVLKRGGNAADAAAAVGYALAVVYPAAGNLGGGGFMTIQLAAASTALPPPLS